ncbi:MAG: DUF4411 family protein, partial [Chloroflexota bacterium]
MSTYCIDTSSLISAWSERYPIKNFPGFWKQFEKLIDDGYLVSPEEVRYEIIKKTEGLDVWVKQHRHMFVALDADLQLTVRDILTEFPWLTKNLPGRNSADPFVIALAKIRNYYLYLIVDGTYFSVIYDGEGQKMPILAAIGIDAEGKREVLGF